MIGTPQVSYYVLSPAELDRLLTESASRDWMMKEATACKRFEIGRATLQELVNDGKVTKHVIPGRQRLARYSYNQLRSVLKPL